MSCPHTDVRAYRRLATAKPLWIVLGLAGLVVLFIAVLKALFVLAFVAIVVVVGLSLLPRLGMRYWGGTQCLRCGKRTMLR